MAGSCPLRAGAYPLSHKLFEYQRLPKPLLVIGSVLMQSYRCYLLDESDHITSYIQLRAVSDANAIAEARRYARLACKPFELWRGRQLICRESYRCEEE